MKMVYAELSEATHFGATAMWMPHSIECEEERLLSWSSGPQWRSDEEALIACAWTLELADAMELALRQLAERYVLPLLDRGMEADQSTLAPRPSDSDCLWPAPLHRSTSKSLEFVFTLSMGLLAALVHLRPRLRNHWLLTSLLSIEDVEQRTHLQHKSEVRLLVDASRIGADEPLDGLPGDHHAAIFGLIRG
jgi:hypothetical protein